MLKRTVSGIVLTLLLISMSTLTFNVQLVWASGTVYIRADGSIDPPTAPISSIDNVTYTFIDDINNPIVVQKSNIVIDGAGYVLQGAGTQCGLYWLGMNNLTIRNTNIKNFQIGIKFDVSSSNTISENSITGSWYGIFLMRANDNSVTSNNIAGCGTGISVIEGSSRNNVCGNIVANSHDAIDIENVSRFNIVSENNIVNSTYAFHFESGPTDNIISRNNVTNSSCLFFNRIYRPKYNHIDHNNFINYTQRFSSDPPFGPNVWDDGYPSGGNYWRDYNATDSFSGPYQNETGSDGIGDVPYVIESDNQDGYPLMKTWVPFENQTIYIKDDGSVSPSGAPIQRKGDLYTLTASITSDGSGIVIERDNVIFDGAGFTLQGMEYAVYLKTRLNVTVRNTNVRGGTIFVLYCSQCTISANNVTDSGERGILLEGGWRWDPWGGHIFSGNNITHCGVGIWFNSSGNIFDGNYIAYNEYGMLNYDSTRNNTFSRNTIAYNHYGVGLFVSENQLMYHNSFLSNTVQVQAPNTNITFFDCCHGNYWSDYNGTDSNGDGIGDTPYVIDPNNQDNHPLMSPYLYADVNHDAVVDMRDIDLTCDAFNSYPGHPRWNPHCDINEDGIVNMRDIGIACDNFMERWE